jgi:adenosine deaminase CECR1
MRTVLLSIFLCTPFALADLSLAQKLERQWSLYAEAHDLVVRQAQRSDLPIEQRLVSRAQWEALLNGVTFTSVELDELRQLQRRRIAASRAASVGASIIDLQRVRAEQRVQDFCRSVPKGGMLHVHPFGTVDRSEADHLLQTKDPSLQLANISDNATLTMPERVWLSTIPSGLHFSALNVQDQQHFSNFLFLPLGKQSFGRFNAVFQFLNYAISDWQAFSEVVLKFAQKAVAEGVSYVELTSLTNDEFYPMLADVERQTGLRMRVNYSFVRTQTVAQIDDEWRKVSSQPANKYLVGIDLLDDESENPALEKGQLVYAAAQLKGLHRTMHAGEIGDLRNPRDAMILGAERLGHGVNLAKDPVALEYAIHQHEAVEVNISSNLRLTDVPSVQEHPFLNYLRLGLPVSLSTDDEGIFDTDIIAECRLVIENSDVNYTEWKQMAINSIVTSFAAATDKADLLRDLQIRFSKFEHSWH